VVNGRRLVFDNNTEFESGRRRPLDGWARIPALGPL